MNKTHKALMILSAFLLVGLTGIAEARGGGGGGHRGGGGHGGGHGGGGHHGGGRGGYHGGGRGGYWSGGRWIAPVAVGVGLGYGISSSYGSYKVWIPEYIDEDGYLVPGHYEWR